MAARRGQWGRHRRPPNPNWLAPPRPERRRLRRAQAANGGQFRARIIGARALRGGGGYATIFELRAAPQSRGERPGRATNLMARIIAVANQKGGVGKTTTTANLGASLAELHYRVLLADMDPQGNLTAAFGLERQAERTIADALLDRQCPLPIVSANHAQAGLDLVPSAIPLAGAEAALMNKLGRELRLRDQLATVEDAYDFIVIDTPPAL